MRQKSARCEGLPEAAAEAGKSVPAHLPAPVATARAEHHPFSRAVADKADVDAQARRWIMERLREVAERCLQAVPPPARGKDADGVWKFDAAGAVRALNLMGKELGMFSERVEHLVNVHEQSLEELE